MRPLKVMLCLVTKALSCRRVSGTYLVNGSCFGQMSLLTPPMMHVSNNRTWTQVCWVKNQHFSHSCYLNYI